MDGIFKLIDTIYKKTFGFKDEDFSKPLITIACPYTNITPCNAHIQGLGEEVIKQNVAQLVLALLIVEQMDGEHLTALTMISTLITQRTIVTCQQPVVLIAQMVSHQHKQKTARQKMQKDTAKMDNVFYQHQATTQYKIHVLTAMADRY